MNLRQRLRKRKIRCVPWTFYRGEVRRLPISGQTLFAKTGEPWDIVEMSLKEEGYLLPGENLWDALADLDRLMLDVHHLRMADPEEGLFDESWSEEDYANFYNNL